MAPPRPSAVLSAQARRATRPPVAQPSSARAPRGRGVDVAYLVEQRRAQSGWKMKGL